MPIGSLLAGLAILLLAGLYIAKPLIRPRHAPRPTPTREEDLTVQKDAILQHIRDLEFDHDTGKVPDDAFAAQRAALVAEAAELMRQIDAHNSAELPRKSGAIDDEIEAAVARLRRVPDPQQ